MYVWSQAFSLIVLRTLLFNPSFLTSFAFTLLSLFFHFFCSFYTFFPYIYIFSFFLSAFVFPFIFPFSETHHSEALPTLPTSRIGKIFSAVREFESLSSIWNWLSSTYPILQKNTRKKLIICRLTLTKRTLLFSLVNARQNQEWTAVASHGCLIKR